MAYSGWPASGDKPAATSTDADSDSIKASRVDIQKAVVALNKIIDIFQLETEPTDNYIVRYDASAGKFETTADADSGAADQNLWHTIDSDSGSTTPNSTTDTLTVSGGTGITTAVSGDTLTITGSATTYQFLTVAVDGQSDVVAESATDTLTLVAGTNITITTDASADSVTITGAESTVGTHDIWVPASAMYPSTTNGATAATTTEVSATKPEIRSLDFAAAAIDYAQFNIAMPKSWNEGTITAEFYWVPGGSGGVSDGVTWAIQGVALSNDGAHNTAFGTAVEADDLYIALNDLHISPTTPAMTIDGSPAAGDITYFQVYRAVGDAHDDLARDAKLIGVKLHFTTEAGTDA